MGSTTPVASASVAPPLPLGRLAGIGLIVFFANAALLVLQLVAGRLLAPFVGSSLETWTSIIGVFLLGIALGNAFGGRLADRYPSPRTLAMLLAAGAMAALWMVVFPQMLAGSGAHKSIMLVVRIPLLALVLCLPAGFTLSLLTPLAIKLGLPDVSKTGRVAGMIFALSTAGCLLGNYLTGFVLIPSFTINTLVFFAAGVLAVLAAGTLVTLGPAPVASEAGLVAQQLPTSLEEPTPVDPKALERWKSAILITTALFLVMIVLTFLTDSSGPGWLIVLGTAIWAVTDSVELEMHKYEGRWGDGRLSVFLGILVLWIVMYPMYLVARSRRIAGVLRLRQPAQQATVSSHPYAFTDIRLAYTIVFLASFGGMTLELTASRVLAEYLGVSLFTWTGIIGVMLAGTALGNFTGGLFADRAGQPGGMRRPLGWFAAIGVGLCLFGLIYLVLHWVCPTLGVPVGLSGSRQFMLSALIALVAAYGTYQLVGRFANDMVNPRWMLATTLVAAGAGTVLLLVIRTVLTQTGPFEELDPILQVMGWTFSLFFLPMFLLGMVSPQVIRLAVPDVAHVGRVAGRVYAWSTAGAIVGTFAAGYVLLSSIGMDRALLVVSLLLTLTSLLIARVWENNSMLYLFSIVLGGVTGGFILTARGDTDPRLIAKLETNYYTIKVTEQLDATGRPTGVRVLYLDALIHSEVDPAKPSFLHYTHEHIQVEFLWAARAENATPRALVIGGGGYTFQRYAMELLPETRMDVVEIDPGVTKVAYEYLGLHDYSGLNIHHMDGRQFVSERASPGTYDLVVQDAVNDLSVPAHLLTREYNDAVKRTLRPDGTYLLTVIDSIRYGRLWRSAMRTLGETFAHVDLVSSTPIPSESPPTNAGEADIQEWHKERKHFDDNRQVLVIYASDRPLKEERIRTEAYKQMDFVQRGAFGAAAGAAREGAVGAALGAMAWAIHDTSFYTYPIPPTRLAPFLAADPGVLLTDQFAPVDNLMIDVFRYRSRARPDE